MSTTASEPFTTTLLLASRAADRISVNGYLFDVFEDDDEDEEGNVIRDGFFDDDGERIEFLDQPITVVDGLSEFTDISGSERTICFLMVRPISLADVVAHRLKE